MNKEELLEANRLQKLIDEAKKQQEEFNHNFLSGNPIQAIDLRTSNQYKRIYTAAQPHGGETSLKIHHLLNIDSFVETLRDVVAQRYQKVIDDLQHQFNKL